MGGFTGREENGRPGRGELAEPLGRAGGGLAATNLLHSYHASAESTSTVSSPPIASTLNVRLRVNGNQQVARRPAVGRWLSLASEANRLAILNPRSIRRARVRTRLWLASVAAMVQRRGS